MNAIEAAHGELQGYVALVTGAAQGLGLGIASELARQGAAVVLADLQQDKAEAAARSLRDLGLAAHSAAVNMADSRSVSACFQGVVESQGRLDIVVNNAGVGQNVAAVADLTDDEWQRVIDVTLTGTFYGCREAARIMQQRAYSSSGAGDSALAEVPTAPVSNGAIVNIASINGQSPAALVAAYNVAKAGVISLTQTLALELASYGIRVNAVSPGPVYTEFNKTVMAQRCRTLNLTEEQMIERVRGSIPLGRWGESADISAAVAFLCGPRASWITGEVIRVSGGLAGVSAAPPRKPPGQSKNT